MLVRLALETRQHHAEADADRLAMMEVRSLADYRDCLARIYGFESAIECAVEALPERDRTWYATRAKRDRLHADLVALGMTEAEIAKLPRSGSIRIRTASHALGWVFVIERQTLLAGLLRRHLEHARPDWIKYAGSYLLAYAESTGQRFRTFGDALGERAKRSGAEPASIVAAANDAFRSQRQWYLASTIHERIRTLFNDPATKRSSFPEEIALQRAPTAEHPIETEAAPTTKPERAPTHELTA